jgi:hypothetical protein
MPIAIAAALSLGQLAITGVCRRRHVVVVILTTRIHEPIGVNVDQLAAITTVA